MSVNEIDVNAVNERTRKERESTVKIKKGWYRSAGVKYGWVHAGYESEGVGINRDALYNNDVLKVEVNGQEYTVDTKEAITFVKLYKSHYAMPGGTKIGVISRSIMKQN